MTGAGSLFGEGDGADGFEDSAGDFVGVALGVGAAIFEVALVVIFGHRVGDADGGAAVGDAVAELVPGCGFMFAGEAFVVVGSVDVDVGVEVFFEGGHEAFEIGFAADFAHVLGGEVGVHAGAVPVGVAEGLAMPVDVDAVLFAEACEEVAGDPHFVGGFFGAFAEDLEFPLSFGDFGVDAFVVDAALVAEFEVGVDDFAGDTAHEAVADAAVIATLAFLGEAFLGEAKGLAVLVKEVFLLEAEPGIGIIENGGAGVGGMGCEVGEEYFAKNDHAVLYGGVGVTGDGFEDAIGVMSFGLLGGTAVEAPIREFFERGEGIELFDERFSAEVRDGGVAIEPNVFELVLCHRGYHLSIL